MQKKIPYGIQSFEKIRETNSLYVDKTEYIEKLENINEDYLIFLRPRKFGKTLWVNTLSKYYDINYKEKFKKLFSDLYIGKNPTPKRSSYYILNFDFSGIQTRTDELLLNNFKNEIFTSIKSFIINYNLNNILSELNSNDEPAVILNKFLAGFNNLKLNNKIYLLIDEYDHFANELLGFRMQTFKESVSRAGFVRKFFEEIKKGAKTVIDRLFITGVSPITLDSMTSGFNIGGNITIKPEFNEMLGFTKEEVRQLLKMYDIQSEILTEMERCYNGYQFAEDTDIKVYNSDMVLYFLKEYIRGKNQPRNIIDTNISSDYKKIQKLFEFNTDYKKLLERVLTNELIPVNITEEFNIEKEQNRDDFMSLLFYLGYLTIKESGIIKTKMGIPNYAIELLYHDYFNMLLNYETEEITDVIEEIAFKGKLDKFAEEINKMLKALSNRDFIKFDEKHIKLLMVSYLLMMKQHVYVVKSEYEVEGGYIDIMMFRRYKEITYNIMIELKYIKESEADEQTIKQKIEDGREQIRKYAKAEEFKNDKYINKYVIVAAGAEVKEIVQV